jgi:hypothetical protein
MTKEQLIEGLSESFKDRAWLEACVKRRSLSIALLDLLAGQRGPCGPGHRVRKQARACSYEGKGAEKA